MILKRGDTVLDFSGPVEIDRQAKLFEEIDAAVGDIGFAFEMPDNGHNRLALGMPLVDSLIGSQYIANESVAMNDSGTAIYFGAIRVEGVKEGKIRASFSSGNSNWFTMLKGDMSELNISKYDTLQTQENVIASWSNTSGMVYPWVDAGPLKTRRAKSARAEDFVPGLFLHTIFEELFQASGLKIRGEMITHPLFNQIGVLTNAKNDEETEARSSNVNKVTDQTLPSNLSYVKVTFDNDSDYPYFDGKSNNFSLVNNRYTADLEMDLQVKLNLQLSAAHWTGIVLYKNGNPTTSHQSVSTSDTNTLDTNIHLVAGDYIEWYARNQVSGGPSVNITSGNLEITPTYIFKSFAKSTLPKWTKQQFVSNILQIFNAIPTYDPFTKTVTFDLFDKIKGKPSIDISEYITGDIEVDYVDFISNYGRSNIFGYSDASEEETERYNASSFIKYGAGQLIANNDFIQESADVISSDFTSPISYIHPYFKCSIDRMELIELVDGDPEADIATVQDDGAGNAKFMLTDADDLFNVGDLVRLEFEDTQYNGEYIVIQTTSTFLALYDGVFYTNSPGKITRMRYENTSNDDVFLVVHTGARTITTFSQNSTFLIGGATIRTVWAHSYFNMLATGKPVDAIFKQGLCFGKVNNQLAFQRTLLDAFWQQFARILNSPVKLICPVNLPETVNAQIDFNAPVSIKTNESTNEYYVNKVQGYQGRQYQNLIELIQLP